MKTTTLFSGDKHGAFTFNEVLNHHKDFDKSPFGVADGIVWLSEHIDIEKVNNAIEDLHNKISELTEFINKKPYNIWIILDTKRHFLKCRLQLLTMARANYFGNFNPYKLK